MEASQLKSEVDRAYAERMDARQSSVRDEVAAITSHPYDDWHVEDYIDPALTIAGKSTLAAIHKARRKIR